MQQIYKKSTSEKHKQFEKLLNNKLSNSVKEGSVVDGKITSISDKFISVEIEGAKSEGVLDLNELKILKEDNKLKVGNIISILIEKIEDKNGDLVISREKAKKMKSWKRLESAYENKKEVVGKIISKIKGGFIVDVDTAMCFLPGSQVDLKPLKNIDHLMKEPQKFVIVKCDKVRGNIVLSRRQILENIKEANTDEIINKFTLNDIVEGKVKGITAYGVFFDLDGFDCMCHINEISWSRVNHPEEIFDLGQKQKLKIINIDKENKKISVSIKQLTPDPFEIKVNNYKVGKIYPAEVKKIMDYGVFLSLEDGLEGLCHQSEISHTKKNTSAKKIFHISQNVNVMIKEIDIEKRRISLSFKDTIENPWNKLESNFPVGSKVNTKITSIADFALFVSIEDFEIDGMVHYKDLSYEETDKDLKKFNKNENIELKILEIDKKKQKVRLGLKQLIDDPFNFFKGKKNKDILTVVVKEIEKNGIKVSPDGCSLKILIKKNQIAIDKEDQRVNRFTIGDRLDVMIQDCNIEKRNISLSIKMLEEEENKSAIKKYGSVDSGKSLPFADLNSTLEKENNKKEDKS